MESSFSTTSTLPRIPPLKEPSVASTKGSVYEQTLIDIDELFDNIMERVQTNTTVYAVESLLTPVFNNAKCILWYYLEDQEIFYSPTLNESCDSSNKFLQQVFESKRTTLISSERRMLIAERENNSNSPDFSNPEDHLLFIPFFPRNGSVGAILEISSPESAPFTSEHQKIARALMSKFRSYYYYLINNDPITNQAESLLMSTQLPESYQRISESLGRFYSAKKVEFWMLRTNDGTMIKIDSLEDENPTQVDPNKSGIAGYCLERNLLINERYIKNHRHYYEPIDGHGDNAILCVPFRLKENRQWAVVLRGRVSPPHYNKTDEATLMALAPFAIKSISSAILPPSDLPQFDDFEKRLEILLEVAESLSGELDIDALIPTIMERACNLLNAQRCSLFLVEKQSGMLVSYFAGGVENGIRIPISSGIVGQTAVTGEVMNIRDAYQDKRFNKSIDLTTGFKTVSLLTVPIYNNRGEITGVTEMINKMGGKTFDEDDTRMMTAFNVFCGISLDNAKLYKASLDLSKQLTTFTEMSSKIENQNSEQTLKEILMNAKNTISATSAIIYKFNSDDRSFQILESVGKSTQYGTEFAEMCVNERVEKLWTSDEIDQILFPQKYEEHGTKLASDDSSNESVLSAISAKLASGRTTLAASANLSSNSRVSSLLTSQGQIQMDQLYNESLCCLPLTNNEETILGVIQFTCPWKIIPEDIKMLKSFAAFAALIIERRDLKSISEYGQDEVELEIWMTPEERKSMTKIPAKFVIPEKVLKENVFTIGFNSLDWDGIGHFKVIFNIFNYFEFFSIFKITNEKLFRFLYAIRAQYKKVPYHNWRHAVDVTQFVSYEIMISGLEKVFTKFELFAIIVACICHDANHDGFTNIYNVKAETPLGILYKNQSVMETHHCSIAIQVLSREECNLLECLNQEEYITIWNLIIQFILATDMARHFEILKKFNDIYDGGDFTMQRSDHRLMLLQMVLKCGDISNVSRPFDLADRWCDVLCEEFFRQGDLEAAQGMEYTSDNNDRAHLNKPKSQIGFYTFVCLPMFQAAGKAVPALDVNMRQVVSNLTVWKKKHEEQEEQERQAKQALAEPQKDEGGKTQRSTKSTSRDKSTKSTSRDNNSNSTRSDSATKENAENKEPAENTEKSNEA